MSEPSYRESLRGEIVGNAARVLETEGLEAMQARRIARDAGCSVGTLYNLFGDIDGLLIAVNATTLSLLGQAVGTEGDRLAGRPLGERLTGLALAYMNFALAHQRRWEAVFNHRLETGRAVPQSYIQDQERLIGLIEAAIADVVEQPERRGATARALFGAVHGIVALALDNRLGGHLRGALESHIRLIVDLAARGLTSEAGQPRAKKR